MLSACSSSDSSFENVTPIRPNDIVDTSQTACYDSTSGTVDYNDKMWQYQAAAYCSNLTTGGYTWRLPSIKGYPALLKTYYEGLVWA